MPWPATCGLNQLAVGTIAGLTNATSSWALSVINAGSTVATAAAVGQTVLALIGFPGATASTASNAQSIFIPGVHFDGSILTAGTLTQKTTSDLRNFSLLVFLTPAAP